MGASTGGGDSGTAAQVFLCRRPASAQGRKEMRHPPGKKVEKTINKLNNMDHLILELKEEIIKILNLEGVTPDDIADDAPLFGEGLSLDSIDALELIVLMDKNYGIRLQNPNDGREIFKSVKTMAEYVAANRTK
jgi:acyl carrier protein